MVKTLILIICLVFCVNLCYAMDSYTIENIKNGRMFTINGKKYVIDSNINFLNSECHGWKKGDEVTILGERNSFRLHYNNIQDDCYIREFYNITRNKQCMLKCIN